MQSRHAKDRRERLYRFYLTDALKAIGNLDKRYYDLICEAPAETRSAEEIKDGIKAKLRALSE